MFETQLNSERRATNKNICRTENQPKGKIGKLPKSVRGVGKSVSVAEIDFPGLRHTFPENARERERASTWRARERGEMG